MDSVAARVGRQRQLVLASRYAGRLPGREEAFAFVSSARGARDRGAGGRGDELAVDAIDGMMDDARRCERCISLVDELGRGGGGSSAPGGRGGDDDDIEWEGDSDGGGAEDDERDRDESMRTLRSELSELRRLIVVRHLPRLRRCIDALTADRGGGAAASARATSSAGAAVLERATEARDRLSTVDARCEALRVSYFSPGLLTSGFDVQVDDADACDDDR